MGIFHFGRSFLFLVHSFSDNPGTHRIQGSPAIVLACPGAPALVYPEVPGTCRWSSKVLSQYGYIVVKTSVTSCSAALNSLASRSAKRSRSSNAVRIWFICFV